jgi:hypothetical protein
MRGWIGLGLLSASWLWGLGYYQPGSWTVWAFMVVLGTLLVAEKPSWRINGAQGRVVMAMLLPAVWFMPWPYRAAPLLVATGLALQLVPIPRRWPAPLGWGAVQAGIVLLVQALAMLAYAGFTARSHDLPGPLVRLIGAIASLVGAEVAVDGPLVVFPSIREVYRLAATWDLLVDPASFTFLFGGLTLLGLWSYNRMPPGRRESAWRPAAGRLVLLVVAWLPVRVGLLVPLLLHRSMRADLSSPLTTMEQFLSAWVHLGALAGPILLAWWLIRMPWGSLDDLEQPPPEPEVASSRWEKAAWALVFAGVALLTFVVEWDPIGRPKGGRVMVVERHSDWEPTTRPYDTKSYGEDASYTYAAIYDYCSRFFEMSRLMPNESIDNATLSKCDVLMVKIPTEPYAAQEVAAITRFVERGGGLLLIGDHTNFELSSTYLNDIARPFGFKFAHDLLFQVGSPYVEWHDWPVVRHPVLEHVPSMHFAGSCTIDPGRSFGRTVVQTVGKWSLPPDYYPENFFPQAMYRPEMRTGAFIQAWATRHGRGRVLAFTDSTIFSNFSAFEPGKPELMLGMLQWLNYSSPFDSFGMRLPVLVLGIALGLAAFAGGLAFARRLDSKWLTLTAAGVLGWTLASMLVGGLQQASFAAPKAVRPMVEIVFDRTVSDVALCRGGFTTEGKGEGYGLVEQWIPRLGYFPKRRSGPAVFSGDALVIICPSHSVPEEYRRQLVDYVKRGGKLLLIDSPDNQTTTANSLLWPFGLSLSSAPNTKGHLRQSEEWPDIRVQAAYAIHGGKPFMWVGPTPVGARIQFGKGSVMAIGFGAVLNDAGMGDHWMRTPDADQRTRYDLLYSMVRGLMEDQPVAPPEAKNGAGKEP